MEHRVQVNSAEIDSCHVTTGASFFLQTDATNKASAILQKRNWEVSVRLFMQSAEFYLPQLSHLPPSSLKKVIAEDKTHCGIVISDHMLSFLL